MSDNYIRKVEALITRANHSDTNAEEREACLNKADEIMAKHRLDRAMLFKSGKPPEKEIIVKTIDRLGYTAYRANLQWIRDAIHEHCGVMFKYQIEDITLIGYEEDIFYSEMLWSSVYMEFTSKLFPRWDKAKTFDFNVYTLKNAGYSWPQVRDFGLAEKTGDMNGPLTLKNAGSKLRTAFKREVARNGVEVLPGKQQPMNPKAWRDSFAQGFENTLYNRLAILAMKAKDTAGEAGVIALMTDSDRVKHRFWELFPENHPEAVRRAHQELLAKHEEFQNGLSEAEKAKNERRREAQTRKWSKEFDKRVNSASFQAGYKAGEDVAQNLSLGRESAVSERTSTKELQ